MSKVDDALKSPEDYLWVNRGDGTRWAIDRDRLWELYEGAAPEDEVEQMLANDREWLRILVKYALGEYLITISPGEPLEKWPEEWVHSVES